MSETSFSSFANSLILELSESIFEIESETFFQSRFMHVLQRLFVILYNIASCEVKLFVAETPISGQQLRPITTSDSCERDELR